MSEAARLTIREVEILRLVALGYMNKQIATQCHISEQTAKNSMTRIFRKLDAANRTQAVIKAAKCGLVPID